jgi:hypothetical protein
MTPDELLTELESVSAAALLHASTGDTICAASSIERRGVLIQKLTAMMAQSEPLSYTDWNRLVVIHYQGSRIAVDLHAARVQIAHEFVETSREHAYLGCISGVVQNDVAAQLNEQA